VTEVLGSIEKARQQQVVMKTQRPISHLGSEEDLVDMQPLEHLGIALLPEILL
jgi:hypothetical protein